MLNNEELINNIVDIEWEMFQAVPNIGGRAPCQEEYKTFKINRISQAVNWSKSTLESYLADLTEAEKQGKNPLTEKYARMMESTSPREYSHIVSLLPPLDIEVKPLVEKIIKIVLVWEEEIKSKYPDITKRGRPIYSLEDTPRVTSVETYLRGELATFSLKTLKLYFDDVLKQRSENINGAKVSLEYMMKQYGFNSLEEANKRLKSRN